MKNIIVVLVFLSIALPSKFGIPLFLLTIMAMLIDDILRQKISKRRLLTLLAFSLFLLLQDIIFSDFYYDGIKLLFLFYILSDDTRIFTRAILLKISKSVLMISSFCIFTQLVFPNATLWSYISENQAQYDAFIAGYAPLSSTGHPTHAAYINLICSVALFVAGAPVIYPLMGFMSLVLLKNKICLLAFIISIALSEKVRTRLFLFAPIILVLFYMAYVFLFSHYIDEWTSSDFNAHTIRHRVDLFFSVIGQLDDFKFILFGEPDLVVYAGDYAFDSLLLLLLTRYGIVITLLIYLLLYRRSIKVGGLSLFIAIAMPSLTAVTFYHPAFLFFIGALLSIKNNIYFNAGGISLHPILQRSS